MLQNIRLYLGVPQTNKLPVHTVQSGYREVISQVVLSNTTDVDAKITVTINTIDVIKDLVISPKETRFLSLEQVLESNDTLSLQQDTENALNVVISGVKEIATVV